MFCVVGSKSGRVLLILIPDVDIRQRQNMHLNSCWGDYKYPVNKTNRTLQATRKRIARRGQARQRPVRHLATATVIVDMGL